MERKSRQESKMAKEELSNFLLKEIQKRGLSGRKLSTYSGLSPATVHNIMNSTYMPTPNSLNKLADYLGVKRQFLWQLAGLLPEDETFTDDRLRYCFARVDKLPDASRTMVINMVDYLLTFLEEGE